MTGRKELTVVVGRGGLGGQCQCGWHLHVVDVGIGSLASA